MAQNDLFPIFLKLNTLDVLLVGGGNVGLEKISAMLQNSPEARITVVAPMILDSLREYIHNFEQVQIVDELPDKKIEFVPEENIESYYNLYTDLASA